MVADLDASGGTVFAVGGFEGGNEFSVAIAGVNPMASVVTVIARRRVMSSSFPVANREQRCGLELRSFLLGRPSLPREERPAEPPFAVAVWEPIWSGGKEPDFVKPAYRVQRSCRPG
jgi:hypothetical protein